ncbi:hypothetical protein GQ53DRAFT_778442 [Thozetella sp. PMI_491]|nr:hypothetical protein GQ53DRAFT_778442 [Thozetella sp. PMI_491]
MSPSPTALLPQGIGATGLIEALANDYLSTFPEERSIAWVCNHSLNSQVALYRRYVDIALTYERDREELAANEGWSRTAGCICHDHFVLAGPRSDPAGVRDAKSLEEALERIATRKALFHSRTDGSATMVKERGLWSRCRLQPWTDDASSFWYKTSLLSPAEALKQAAAAGAYLLNDRSTLLRQTALNTISNITVFFEPRSSDDYLMNSCYAVYSPQARPEIVERISHFLNYLVSARGQGVIASFGVDSCGLPLFAPVKDGFAKTRLVGGEPLGGRWKHRSML